MNDKGRIVGIDNDDAFAFPITRKIWNRNIKECQQTSKTQSVNI
jgi:hypothetical protein